jgi:subtilisin
MALAGFLVLVLTEGNFAQQKGPGKRVLIGFKDGTGRQAIEGRRALIRGRGGEVRRSYRFLPAVSAELPETQISSLRADPRVAYIEEDGLVYALDKELDNSWGVKHIGAGEVHSSNKGAGVKVAIIDTGIDYTHPDLDANYKGGYDFVNDADPKDDEGHGTHVAGIIAAEDNGNGVVGVAPQASLYAVKVLDSGGSGYISDVVAGIEWAIENGMDIISMSLGTNSNYKTLRDACDQASAAGILVVAAAGNDYKRRKIGRAHV